MPRLLDRRGKQYGELTVIERAPSQDKHVYWRCKCSCGNEGVKRGDYFTSSEHPNCGCLELRKKNLKAAICKVKSNQKYGRLLTIRETEQRANNGGIYWECLCDCGKTVRVEASQLTKKNNPTQSCGCLQKEIASQTIKEHLDTIQTHTGDIINNFYILETKVLPTNNGQSETWGFVICPFCGQKVWKQIRYIKDLSVKSCGCINKSAGEAKIQQLLTNYNIDFIQEKTFEDLKNDNNYKLRFDFFVENKYCIEFDGIQHFEPTIFANETIEKAKEKFIKQKNYDNIKNQWCKKHNIPLIRIPYTHFKELTIQDLLLETSSFVI